jgi:hypothetical protein
LTNERDDRCQPRDTGFVRVMDAQGWFEEREEEWEQAQQETGG